MDIKAIDEDNKQYDVEVQSVGDKSFKSRSLYYWARLYSSQLKEREIYKHLRPAVCINILDFILFEDLKKNHNCFLISEKNDPEYVLTDHLVIHYLELPKIKKIDLKNKLNKWLMFIKNEGVEEDLMKILIKDDELISKAHDEYRHFTEDEKLRDIYESRLKWQLDYNSNIEMAREKGIKEGIKEGMKEGKIEDAKKMLEKGFNIEDIQYITGLSKKEILSIKK